MFNQIKKVIPGFRKIEVPHIVAEIEPFSAFLSFRCIDAFVLLLNPLEYIKFNICTASSSSHS